MGIVVKDSGSDFKPAPAGLHQGVCVDIVDLGMVKSSFGGEEKEQWKVRLVWQIDERDAETEKRFIVSNRYTASLHEKANLRKALESWRGRAFLPEELRGFDLENVLGANCQLQVIHASKDGKTYANIAAIVPLAKGTPQLEPEGYVRMKDRQKNPGEGDHFEPTDDDVPF